MADWISQPRQDLFLYTHADLHEIFFGGSAGGGKTDALLIWQMLRRTQYPGSKGLFLRRRFVDLNQPGAAIDRFRGLFGARVRYDSNTHEAHWPNGSVTKFGYLETDADRHQYQGAQYDDISFDELTQFTELQYLYLFSRARVVNADLAALGLKTAIRGAGNPGGIGHGWVKRRFVKECRDTVYTDPDTGLTRIFIPSRVTDNQALLAQDPQYLQMLMALPEKERRQLLDGDWDVFEGQVFNEWRRDIHVIPPLLPPAHWRRWIGFDWGYAAPFVALWFAEDPDTRQVVVYRQVKGTRAHDNEIAERILQASEAEEIQYMSCDPSIWTKKNGTSTADVFQRHPRWTIRLEPADNDRLNGLRQVHNYLGWEPDGAQGMAISPLLRVTENCTGLIQTLPELIHDPIKVEDVDTDGDDHDYDALRYGIMSRKALFMPARKHKSSTVLFAR